MGPPGEKYICQITKLDAYRVEDKTHMQLLLNYIPKGMPGGCLGGKGG
jgi:hypothetical protein